MSTRDRLCHAVAKLPENISLEEVINQLSGFGADNVANVLQADDGEDVTPLMVACDKDQGTCLEYAVLQYSKEVDLTLLLWGRPDASSSEKCGANTALHHAGMSGCVQALESLVSLMMKVNDVSSTRRSCLVNLLSKTNAHGDTPIMMACVNNQVAFLENVKEKLVSMESEEDSALLSLLLAKNAGDENPLSLGFGHGHGRIVQWLLTAGVPATYEMVQDCKKRLDEIDALLLALRRKSASSTSHDNAEHQQRRDNVKRCLVILEVTLAEKARESMEQLLKKETEQEELRPKTKARKKKSKRNGSKAAPKQQDQGAAALPLQKRDSEKETILGKAWDKKEESSLATEPLTLPRFQTLPDGSLVKNIADIGQIQVILDTHEQPVVAEETNEGASFNTKSADEMLRERIRAREGGPILPAVPKEDESYDDTDVDAVMDSLCLDASMLLLNSHGMAMNLSPSQLEAIASILNKQMQSVQEAKAIQERLRR